VTWMTDVGQTRVIILLMFEISMDCERNALHRFVVRMVAASPERERAKYKKLSCMDICQSLQALIILPIFVRQLFRPLQDCLWRFPCCSTPVAARADAVTAPVRAIFK
jgi:hypothetical protein